MASRQVFSRLLRFRVELRLYRKALGKALRILKVTRTFWVLRIFKALKGFRVKVNRLSKVSKSSRLLSHNLNRKILISKARLWLKI